MTLPLQKMPSPMAAAAIGAFGLASAMGIGRFAFTPLLPLMQHSVDLSLRQGGWLATANYVGYFLGALISFVFTSTPSVATRVGLLSIAALTLAMGLTHTFPVWMVLRLLTGMASAYVLIGITAWVLGILAQHGRARLYGWVFAGVGLGMIMAGLVGLVAGVWQQPPDRAWLVLGLCAALVSVFTWNPLGWNPARQADRPPHRQKLSAQGWKLAFCYGAFGFGYILPATFLPAFARALISDPSVFGWVWPAFGAAAVASVLIASYVFGHVAPRRMWAYSVGIMAVGVLCPVLAPSMATLVFSACCVGGTFMVVTMAGMQEARRVAGAGVSRLIAAMTTLFAIGQLLGPLTVGSGSLQESAFGPSVGAALLLLASIVVLLWRGRSFT